MHLSYRYLAPLFLTAALAGPVAIMAVPVPQEAHDQNRVYDKDHKDYHEWNDNENRAWQHYLSENHHLTSSPRRTRSSNRNTGIGATAIQTIIS